MNKIGISLATLLSLNTSPKIATVQVNNHCYTEEQVGKLAVAITDLQKCQVELLGKQKLIDEKLTLQPVEAGARWWQEPQMIVGGMVVSFSIGSLLGWYIVTGK
jgi:hypothetical protein